MDFFQKKYDVFVEFDRDVVPATLLRFDTAPPMGVGWNYTNVPIVPDPQLSRRRWCVAGLKNKDTII